MATFTGIPGIRVSSSTEASLISPIFTKAFIKAFEDDTNALKNLLVGTDALPGIFTQVETIVESAVASTSGYFSSTENNFRNQIRKIDDKIAKANNAVETYRARLESKFQHMDLMISKIQQQYSSFLGT